MLLALLVLAALPTAGPAVDFKNYTYDVTPCNPGRVRVHNGEGEEDVQETALYLYVEGVVPGELGPGKSYAVVRLSCSLPVGSSSAAYLYSVGGGKARYLETLATADPGEGHMEPGWVHVRFTRDLLYVDHCVSADDCDRGIVTTYALRNGKVVPVYTLHHKYKL